MDEYKKQVALESFAVGLILLMLWVLVKPLMPTTELWSVFLLGAGVHLGFEIVGGNKWYCTNGAACKK
jgi:hypothetical protein